ncbi:MAG: cell division protein FtsZ [Pseudomonadota bacterium]
MVVGVGGAGGNAINTMIRRELTGVSYLAVNTDAQALAGSLAEGRLQIGAELTKGLGAGGKPEVGGKAALESAEALNAALRGAQMVFIAAGMGGGTGTGAAPEIAKMAKELGVLTVGVVTKPFDFEGPRRSAIADAGVMALTETVDTIIVIPNQNLFRVATEATTFTEAFQMADAVLHQGVKGVTDLMMKPGLVNLDFADVKAVIDEMGAAMMGSGEAEGPDRAREAAERAVENPLLDEVTMRGAKGVLINIVGGPDLKLYEVDAAAQRVRQDAHPGATIHFGSTIEPEMEGRLRVSVVATGVQRVSAQHAPGAEAGSAETVRVGAESTAEEDAAGAPVAETTVVATHPRAIDQSGATLAAAPAAPAEPQIAGQPAARDDDLVRKMAQTLTHGAESAGSSVSDAVSAASPTPPRPARDGSRVEIPSFLRRHAN